MQLVEQHGGESHVLTLGIAEADEQCRYAASIGVNKATLVAVGRDGLGPAAHRRRPHRGDPGDRGRADGDVRPDRHGQRVGRHRRLPGRASGSPGRSADRSCKGSRASSCPTTVRRSSCRREIDSGSEVYQLPLPAVVGVKEGITWPRYPDDAGSAGVEEARRVDTRRRPTASPGGQIEGAARPSRGAGVRDGDPRRGPRGCAEGGRAAEGTRPVAGGGVERRKWTAARRDRTRPWDDGRSVVPRR